MPKVVEVPELGKFEFSHSIRKSHWQLELRAGDGADDSTHAFYETEKLLSTSKWCPSLLSSTQVPLLTSSLTISFM